MPLWHSRHGHPGCSLATAASAQSFFYYIPRMSLTSSSAASTSDRLTTVLSYGALLLLIYLVFRIVEPFLVPLAWSAGLAVFFFGVDGWSGWWVGADWVGVVRAV